MARRAKSRLRKSHSRQKGFLLRREKGQQKMTSTNYKPTTQQKSGRLYAMVGFLVLLLAFVAVTLDRHESSDIRNFEKSIKAIPNIKACYHLSGRFDYLLHLVARDLNELGDLVKVGITSLPDFGRCETHLVFSEIESSKVWPSLDEKPVDD